MSLWVWALRSPILKLLPVSQSTSCCLFFVVVAFCFCLFVCLFFKTGFLCSFEAYPGTSSVDQVGLELKEICLPPKG